MLTLDRLQKTLGEQHWQFNHELDSQGVYTLLGRSGSGKSTLLNLIGGFLSPDSGNILWNNESIVSLTPAQRPVTTLFQQYNLFSHLTVWQNIGLGIAPDLKLGKQQREAISEVLHNVGLERFETQRPHQLSGGEQQRVALARCLLRRKPVLLLDEPFSALDGATRQDMVSLLRVVIGEYQPCVLMITHDEADAESMGAEVLVMENGTIRG